MLLRVSYKGTTIELTGSGRALIGRGVDSAVRLDEIDVSNRHAQLFVQDGLWVLEDLGSSNGTFVDGTRIERLIVRQPVTVQLAKSQGGAEIRLEPIEEQAPEQATILRPQPTQIGRRDPSTVSSTITVGRSEDATIRLADLLVSRMHARVDILSDTTAEVTDLGSANGTFVNANAASPTLRVKEGDTIDVGNTTLIFRGGQISVVEPAIDSAFSVERLSVPGRLDAVTFSLPKKSFLAVLGTSGAGKSTLLKAITGMNPATSGSVLFGGRDLYGNFRVLRHQIGYVPQEDILHDQLTVDATLDYGARLRFPDATANERSTRIAEVLADLGLTEHAAKRVNKLSGGQRKRLSVGLELLHQPSLLILDEPTSGLDPGNERKLMQVLDRLAEGGRTVIVVTHSTESLDLCDQVLFLAKGGVTVYFGPPKQLARHFGTADFPEAFAMAEDLKDPAPLHQKFLDSPLGSSIKPRSVHAESAAPAAVLADVARPRRGQFVRHLGIFTGRYLRLLVADRRALITLIAQAPIIAGLIYLAAGSGALRADPSGKPTAAGNVLMALVLGVIYASASNAAREIVKERTILRREQNFGVSIGAYLSSKVLVLGVITILQSIVFVAIGTARQNGPARGVWLANGRAELMVVVAVCGLSAMAVGLFISALVATPDKASTILPMVLLAQFVLAGLVFPVKQPVVEQISWLTSARWGFGAAASTADFLSLRGCPTGPTATLAGESCNSAWQHTRHAWNGNMVILGALAVGFLLGAWLLVGRLDPARSLKGRAPK